MKKTLALATISILAAACGPTTRGDDGTGGPGDDMDPGPGPGPGPGSGMTEHCDKMDIVFVVDDSGSMAEEQSNLGTNFPMFANLLANYTNADGNKVDFRIGITTTGRTVDYDVSFMGTSIPEHEDGDNGAFRNNCGGTGRWLESSDPNMTSSLGCRANVGTSGPGIEMPLLMTKYALAERAADTNNGFIRPDALLAVVMLTDENDQSTTQNHFTIDASDPNAAGPVDFQPTDLVNFLDTTKGNRTRWAAAAIAGDGDCSSNFGDAVDATRLKDFVNQANSQGTTQAVFSSICDGNLTNGLQTALNTFQNACGAIIF